VLAPIDPRSAVSKEPAARQARLTSGRLIRSVPGNSTHNRQASHQGFAGINLIEENMLRNVAPLQGKEAQG
jgi:hypothetical protein